MTPDQDAKFAAIEDRLAEALIRDADPENWPGNGPGVLLGTAQISRQDRGDRDWTLKVAMRVAGLYKHIAEIRKGGGIWGGGMNGPVLEGEEEAKFKAAEDEAAQLLARARSRRHKADAKK